LYNLGKYCKEEIWILAQKCWIAIEIAEQWKKSIKSCNWIIKSSISEKTVKLTKGASKKEIGISKKIGIKKDKVRFKKSVKTIKVRELTKRKKKKKNKKKKKKLNPRDRNKQILFK